MEIPLLLLLAIVSTTIAHFGGLRYTPRVGNIAIGRSISASSTCGVSGIEQYCSPSDGQCGECNNDSLWLQHSPSLMIDHEDSSERRTWWQSNTNTSQVDIQLDFESIFFFNHIILSFKSWRPAAMKLYKSSDMGSSYEPFQFYSNDCQNDFGSQNDIPCTSIYSLPSPGEVIYQTSLQANLSDPNNLKHFLISNLRIHLMRFHSLPGDVTSPQVAVRNYYALYNIDVFGWCYCSGLEDDSCGYTEKESNTIGMVPSLCSCSHNTTGRYCERCLPLYNNVPWKNGFDHTDYNGCPEKCNCNNRSTACSYNEDEETGYCLNCTDHSTGTNCQDCSTGYYMFNGSCQACNCSPVGTLSGTFCSSNNGSCSCHGNVRGRQCDTCKEGTFNLSASNPLGCQDCSCSSCEQYTGRCPCMTNESCCAYDEYYNGSSCISCSCHVHGSYGVCTEDGQCICKPGVQGSRCDVCTDGYHSLTSEGCTPCNCNQYGSRNPLQCNKDTGQCDCLSSVSGVHCDKCPSNSLGPVRGGVVPCVSCYCSGHSTKCTPASGWYWYDIVSHFENESSDWLTMNPYSSINNNQLILTATGNKLQINFPRSYLGNKYTSYGLYLSFNLFISHPHTLLLEMFSIIDRVPTTVKRILSPSVVNHTIPLMGSGYMKQQFAMSTPLTEQYIIRQLLANIIWMRLIVTFESDVSDCYVNLSQVILPSTSKQYTTVVPHATVVETCDCPVLYTGSSCQTCSIGYSRDPFNGNQFERCGKCNCNNLADTCDPQTNECINCRNHTTGTHCTDCITGYYRNNTSCLPCKCPGGPNTRNQFSQSCNIIGGGVVCNNCPQGFTGDQCNKCEVGYHGNPTFANGTCRLCSCTNNSLTCDSITGQCICNEGYSGIECQYCQIGYYGNALLHDCQSCACHDNGTVPGTYCNLDSGQCTCRPNVIGRQCNNCTNGYWNINEGCMQCNCSVIGSTSSNDCNKNTGQCTCKMGYTGRTCNECSDGYWRNHNGLCTMCECSPDSSLSSVCNKSTGTCTCLHSGIIGTTCNTCTTGTTGLLPYCELCDECSTRWNAPINELESSIIHHINRSESLTVINITHTNIREGQELIQPVIELLSDIEGNLTDYNSILPATILTHRNITNELFVIQNLIQRANTVQLLLSTVNMTLLEQKKQLTIISQDLLLLWDLLVNLTAQTKLISLRDYTSYITRIQTALSSSNQSNVTIYNTVLPLLEESRRQLEEYSTKEVQFINVSSDIIQLLTILRSKLRQYQNLIIEADHVLCGKDVETFIDSLACGCYGNSERCTSQCGGIGCTVCGGSDCNSTITELQQSDQLSKETMQKVIQFKERLEGELRLIRVANSSSIEAIKISQNGFELIKRETTNTTEILSLVTAVTREVNQSINSELLNTSIINKLINNTLSKELRKTPQQILQLLNQINTTILNFPVIPDYSDLITRTERALNISIQANNTIKSILQNITKLQQRLQLITNRTIKVQTNYNERLRNTKTIQNTINQGREKGVLISDNINKLSIKIKSLNESLKKVRSLFDANKRNLTRIKNEFNETSKQVTKLEEASASIETKLNELTNQTTAKQTLVNNTLQAATQLRERMRSIRRDIHYQLLQTRSLQNRKVCLLSDQERIRDDIKRVAAELETLHTQIQANIGRNTLCMKKFLSSKK